MNPLIAEIPPSLIRSIAARKRPGDVDLGLGEPTIPPDMAPFEAALEWTRKNGSPYSPNAGLMELREAIARYLTAPAPSVASARSPLRHSEPPLRHSEPAPRHSGESGNPESDVEAPLVAASPPFTAANVCVTIGSEEALYLAIKTVVDPSRHEVLIVEPCYLAYPKLCMLEGIRHRMVSLSPGEEFRPRASTILAALSPDTRLIIINTPCNPTGRVWPAAELRALAVGLAARGEEIFVLADEVYRELYFGDEPPASIAEFHAHTLIAGSLSKSSSLTGLRLGWLAGPEEAIAAATKVHQFVNTAASTFSQRVAISLFADPFAPARNRPIYMEARAELIAGADRHGLTLIAPEGAFYALIRLPPPFASDSLAFAERLIDEKRVVTVPGRAFGESGEGWLRISWVAPGEALEEGLKRIGELARG